MKMFCLLMLFCLLFAACGEVNGDLDWKPSSGSEQKLSSSSINLSNSSSSGFNLEWVTLDGYRISRNLITQGQYNSVMGKNAQNNTSPVEGVNWFEAVEFCERLSVSLPTDDEWRKADSLGTIERNDNYWEWTSSCYGQTCIRKGLVHPYDSFYFTDPSLKNIPGGGYISFRVVKRN